MCNALLPFIKIPFFNIKTLYLKFENATSAFLLRSNSLVCLFFFLSIAVSALESTQGILLLVLLLLLG